MLRIALLLLPIFLCSCSPPAKQEAPAVYRVKFETSKGPFVVEVHRDWAPNGADRFYDLVQQTFYDDNRFFRIVKGFIVQFGLNGDPTVSTQWQTKTIPDDPVKQSNTPGMLSFAMAGPGTRTTQIFINLGNNTQSLDPQGFAPFGRVIDGMSVVAQFNAEYAEAPDQGKIQALGNDYLKQTFPNLDFIKTARIEQ
jgi:peptidyl-prolyl cis-trans isomerase A (cyclophilin A)